MALNKELKKVLVLGSGPIEIGQAAEFDYAGTQACQALKEEGIEVVLVNSNPATIMTDPEIADRVYIEPLTCEVVGRVIQQEKPDGILATTGGQTGLNLLRELSDTGILDRESVQVLGTQLAAIQKAEDRSEFRQVMQNLNQPIPASTIVHKFEEAIAFVEEVGFPVVIRPAYTLGGSGGGFADNMDQLKAKVTSGLQQSPIGQVLLEQSIAGMREVEFEVLRDIEGNSLIVCDMENMDPVGIHTGDSVVVAPCQTLTPQEKGMLEKAALDIVDALGVVGSCNVQVAIDKHSGQYYVIEVNPRVSRSSALASKATGYPIARVAAKISLGITLPEMGMFKRPEVNYIVTKIPRWPFDKFPTANRKLGTQMKATGEVMAIGSTFCESIQKAVRSLECEPNSLFSENFKSISQDELELRLRYPDDQRLFLIMEYLRRGGNTRRLGELTGICSFFIDQFQILNEFYNHLSSMQLTRETLLRAKELGFSDADIAKAQECSPRQVREKRIELQIRPSYQKIETGGLPYYYSTYNYQAERQTSHISKNSRSVLILGSGPIRIGQGIEFDYSTVHAAWTLRENGYQAVIVNNNPETVSTDYLTSDRLYFEPLVEEEVWEIYQAEMAEGILVQFGGQTAINLVEFLQDERLPIVGTTAADIAGMEDREQFDAAMEHLNIPRPRGYTAHNPEAVLDLAIELIYPIVVRPSYVLGGRGMEVISSQEGLKEYLNSFPRDKGWPLLMDRYLAGIEVEVDAVSDGQDVFVPGVMEHLERAGVHSGDSIAVFPSQSISDRYLEDIYGYTREIARHFKVKGFLNIQFVIADDQVYVLEVNPRSSRTVPFLSKVTGISLARLATQVCLGESLKALGYTGMVRPDPSIVSVKVPVFSFAKLTETEITLGPEMKSTGEVMGRERNLAKALYKGFASAKIAMPVNKKVLITVADRDKGELAGIGQKLAGLGFELVATAGTAAALRNLGIKCQEIVKLTDGPAILEVLANGEVDLVINTITQGKQPQRDGFRIRREAVERGILCLTSLDTVKAYLQVVEDRELWLVPLEGREGKQCS
jgi:carbamoyl-phosphate synthase large subunit